MGDNPNIAAVPDRVYKIVFVGNSGVGKTSFIQQFACSTFLPSLSATIGVDYQVCVLVRGAMVCGLRVYLCNNFTTLRPFLCTNFLGSLVPSDSKP